MTGYTVHTGTTRKFSEGWDRIFKQKSAARRKSAARKKASSSKRKK